MHGTTDLALVVEDQLSMAVLQRVVAFASPRFSISRAIIGRGVSKIRTAMPMYRNACRVVPHVILVDLDQMPCAPELLRTWGCNPATPGLLLRVAVRETEAWVMADRQGFARFAGVPANKLPHTPETVADPKQTLVNIVRHSRNRRLAAELVPQQGSRLSMGPLYNERLSQFVEEQWDVEAAVALAPSLAKTVARLRIFP